jgi:hypothetical protein
MVIWSAMARENEAREECFGHHLQLKPLIESNNPEDVLGTSSLKHGRCVICFFALNQRFGPGARRILPQLSSEIQAHISKSEQIGFVLRKQAEYSFNAPIRTNARDGQDSHIAPPNRCAEMLQFAIYFDNSISAVSRLGFSRQRLAAIAATHPGRG